MKILFIGGTGNISTDCASLLHEQGHEILVLTRGRNLVPAGYRAIVAERNQISRGLVQGLDLDVVINFLGYELSDVQRDFEVFRELARQYVFISSATVYVKPAPRLPITENTPLGNPWWDYAQKKIACEQWLLERHRRDGFPVTIVRPSHTYSKLWIPNGISSGSYTFAARLEQGKPVFVHDDGQSPWTLTATSDFAVGLAGLLGNPAAIGEAFHITSDEALSWNQIYREIADGLGVAQPQIIPVPTDFICERAPRFIGNLKGDKAHPGIFDNSKLKRFVPGFACRKPFAVGVRESIAWLRGDASRQVSDPELDQVIEDIVTSWQAGKGKT